MAKLTPMMQQFKQIKKEYPDAILFFRVGDFYEMFFEDAVTASRELDITLTSRDGNRENAVPLAGFPHHAASGYIARLMDKGYKVAICEQTEDPSQAQGLVKREVVRVITPGTRIEDTLLEEDRNNYLATVYVAENEDEYGLAVADVSTGELLAFTFAGPDGNIELQDEISRLQPAEILFIAPRGKHTRILNLLKKADNTPIINQRDPFPGRREALDFVRQLNAPALLDSMETITSLAAFFSAASAVQYIKEMQKSALSHFQRVRFIENDEAMFLDAITLRNLEIFETIRSRDKAGSLFGIINRTRTSMGSRLLRKWLLRPLYDREALMLRWEAVEELKNNLFLHGELKILFKEICDLERFCGRLNVGQVGPRDMLALKNSLQMLPRLKSILQESKADLFTRTRETLPDFSSLTEELEKAINENTSLLVKEGNIFKGGYSKKIDELRQISRDGKSWLLELEKQEREQTGIRTLKIGFNKVFGYYLEVSKANQDRVPPHYIRKQTLVNAERYITEELKEKEDLILNAEERLVKLEAELFAALCQKVAGHTSQLQLTAGLLAELDCLYSLADAASAYNYTRPYLSQDESLHIKNGRHPVVEQTGEDLFVPNDLVLDEDKHRIQIITGPNMAGKSTYCRSAALLLIMAQIGGFVPAESMVFTPLKRIFARVGASDDLSRGRSTFMVEMEETASILTSASTDCLVILDEIGRGTSTYDGMSLARAILEYLHEKTKARVLFSTHYHELTALEEQLSGVHNYTVSVREKGDKVIFLRKVVPGKANRSYGINVARMAGLPEEVLAKAQYFLQELEKANSPAVRTTENGLSILKPADGTMASNKKGQLSLFPETRKDREDHMPGERKVIEEIKELNLVNITPLEALLKLFSLQNRLLGLETVPKEKDR